MGKQELGERVIVEHALARLARYGIGQARWFGRGKTRLQLLLVSAIANFRLTWNWAEERQKQADTGTKKGVDGVKNGHKGRFAGILARTLDMYAHWSLNKPTWTPADLLEAV